MGQHLRHSPQNWGVRFQFCKQFSDGPQHMVMPFAKVLGDLAAGGKDVVALALHQQRFGEKVRDGRGCAFDVCHVMLQ
jgi:hypothetical protein